MRVALVHDWLVSIGGGEKFLERIHKFYPGDIFTLLVDKSILKGSYFEDKKIYNSFIQKLPFAKKKHRAFFPLFPLAIEDFDLFNYDLVLSSSHCAAKGALTHTEQLHICYCHSPVRYAWDLYHSYLAQSGLTKGVKSFLAKLFLHYFRVWDQSSSHRVDYYLANSKYIARRIEKIYGKKAEVIYPAVDLSLYAFEDKKEDYYLTTSRMVPYKRIDLIVEAFTKMRNRELVVIGDGPEMDKIKKIAGPNVKILGHQPDHVVKKYTQHAKGFVFAALEDFGLVPVEAQSAGTPVIAYGKGGALETVTSKTGQFFYKQTSSDIIAAIELFEKRTFDPYYIREHASYYSSDRFEKEFRSFVDEKMGLFKKGLR